MRFATRPMTAADPGKRSYFSIESVERTTFVNFPSRSGARISLMMAPELMTWTRMPLEFRSVTSLTSAPSEVLPKDEISTRFTSSAAALVEMKNAIIAAAMARQEEICMAFGYLRRVTQASEFVASRNDKWTKAQMTKEIQRDKSQIVV